MERQDDPAQSSSMGTFDEFRFSRFRRLVLGISLAVATLMPGVAILQDFLLNRPITRASLGVGFLSALALSLYPLALWARAPRRLLPALLLLGPLLVILMDALLKTGLRADFFFSIALYIDLIAYIHVLALPLGPSVAVPGTVLVLASPFGLKGLGLLPVGLSPLRVLSYMVPLALMMGYLQFLLTRDLWRNFVQSRQLAKQAIQDPLSRLHNRRFFMFAAADRLKVCLRSGEPLCILVMDLDHFKRINDTFGHATGDRVIRLAADTLRGVLRASDLVGRFGGEEFIACLPNTDVDSARIAAERIRSVLEGSSLDAGPREGRVRITASIGIAGTRAERESLESLIARADKALYEAKGAGRNQVVCEA